MNDEPFMKYIQATIEDLDNFGKQKPIEGINCEKKEVLMSPQIEENHVWPDPGYPLKNKKILSKFSEALKVAWSNGGD